MTNISTTEPIEINVYSESYGDDMTVIEVTDETGTYDYAVLRGICVDDLNLNEVRYWVEETYYCLSYRCSAYTPCYINAYGDSNFRSIAA